MAIVSKTAVHLLVFIRDGEVKKLCSLPNHITWTNVKEINRLLFTVQRAERVNTRVCVCKADTAWLCTSPGGGIFAFLHYSVYVVTAAATMKHKPDGVNPAVSQSEPLVLYKHHFFKDALAVKTRCTSQAVTPFPMNRRCFCVGSCLLRLTRRLWVSGRWGENTISHGNLKTGPAVAGDVRPHGVKLTSLFLFLGKRVKLPAQRFSPLAYFCMGDKKKKKEKGPAWIKLLVMFKYVHTLFCTMKTVSYLQSDVCLSFILLSKCLDVFFHIKHSSIHERNIRLSSFYQL